MANQAINDLLWLAEIHLMQEADMRHQHSFNTETGQSGTNEAISRPGKNFEYKQKSNAQSHSGLSHAVLFGGISGLILGTIYTCLNCGVCLNHFQHIKYENLDRPSERC